MVDKDTDKYLDINGGPFNFRCFLDIQDYAGSIFRVWNIYTQTEGCSRSQNLEIGALLPDLIDKPVGEVIFASTIANGRIIGHTLFFVLLLALIGVYVYKKRKDSRGLALASGSFSHLLEDQM